MIAYVDSSVLLRLVLGQPDALREWKSISKGITSALTEVECLRCLDRWRLGHKWTPQIVALRHEAVFRSLEEFDILGLTPAHLSRAGQPLPVPLGTLDALHLTTALLWREGTGRDLAVATHDEALALAARASGLRVVGVA